MILKAKLIKKDLSIIEFFLEMVEISGKMIFKKELVYEKDKKLIDELSNGSKLEISYQGKT